MLAWALCSVSDRKTSEGVLEASNDVEISKMVGENLIPHRKKADLQLFLRALEVVGGSRSGSGEVEEGGRLGMAGRIK